jgi:uncharacterized protein
MLAISRRMLGLAVVALLPAVPLQAQVVVSQVYGGGGNSGATFKNDFIELFNRGSAAVDVTGWSVQYTSSGGTAWQATSLSGTIQPGQYYLVQEAVGAGGTVNLPPPDATGTIAMSATTGKVALVNTTTLLTGSGCPFAASVQDLIGYGSTVTCSETSPAPLLSNTTAALRAGLGCTDTNNNSADFAAGVPNPRNTASPLNPCVGALAITTASPLPNGTVGQPYSVTFAASGGTGTGYTFTMVAGPPPPGLTLTDATLSGTPTTTTGSPFTFTIQVTDSGSNAAQKQFQLAVDPALVCNATSTIAQIQGSGDASPLAGSVVTTNGIVTGVKSNGFFIQMPAPGDGDPTTSDGVFVFTSSAPPSAAVVGNDVCVTGTVQEFIPSADPGSPPATEISFTTGIFMISSGNPLPPPVVVTAADTDPAGPIDQLEKYEGMRVHVDSLTAVSPTQGTINEANATSTSNGVFYGVITGVARPFREPGVEVPDALPPGAPANVTRFDSNPERLRVDSDGQVGAAPIDVTTGAIVTGLTGPLDYAFRTYTIDPDPATPPGVSGNVSATPVAAPRPGQFTIGAFNIERFFDTTDDPNTQDAVLTPAAFANRLNKVSLAIRNLMRTPDIVGFEEVENLSTLQSIADKVNADAVAAGDPDPSYLAYLEEGNDIGGIDVGFLVKSARVSVVDVTQEGKDATYINPNNGLPELLNDRPSLVLRAEVQRPGTSGYPVTVIANHLRSLSGIDSPTDGNRVRTKRRAQAEFLANLVQDRQAANPTERIVLVGDFNAFQFSDGYVDVIGTVKGTPTPADEVVLASSDLVNPDLTDLVEMVPAEQRYSYSFDGNAQVIDHVLATGNLLATFATIQFARLDADFPEMLRNDPARPERISDHDPVVATFNLPAITQTVLEASPNPSAFGQPVTFTATVRASGAPVPVGSVTFTVDSNPVASPTPLDANGQAAFTTSALGPGPHAITATYSGTPAFDGSSASVTQNVGAAPSQTVLASSVNPSGFGQPVTFTATVSSLGAPVTQGSVVFLEGATVLAGPLPLDAGGHAAFSTSSLAVGSHAITADYLGTALAQPSTGSVVQVVRAGLSVSDAFVKEGDFGTNVMSFVVTLSPAASQPVTVNAATVDGTAVGGSDYVAASASLTFAPGVTRQTVKVAVNGDRIWEDDETLTLRLSSAVNATIVRGDGVGTILNDDPLPTVRISNVFVREGNSGMTAVSFKVSLSDPSSRTVTVAYTTADGTAQAGSDYVAATGTLTFVPGAVAQTVVVNVKGDTLIEPNEYFFLQATGATNAAIGYGRGIAIILNDDRAP